MQLISVSAKARAKLKYLGGFFVLAAVYLGLRVIIFGPSGLAAHPQYIRWPLSLINFLNLSWRYILLLLWPVNLRMFHSTALISQLSLPVLFLSISMTARPV